MLYTTVVHALPTLLERVGLKRPLRVSNLLFSNPFGLAGRCYLMGAEVELALPMSVVAAGQMLNITVVTLADRLQIGLLGIPGAIDHINRLATHIDAAYQELKADLAATEEVPAASTRRNSATCVVRRESSSSTSTLVAKTASSCFRRSSFGSRPASRSRALSFSV